MAYIDESNHILILNGTSTSGNCSIPLSLPNPTTQRHNQTVQMKPNLERRGETEAVRRDLRATAVCFTLSCLCWKAAFASSPMALSGVPIRHLINDARNSFATCSPSSDEMTSHCPSPTSTKAMGVVLGRKWRISGSHCIYHPASQNKSRGRRYSFIFEHRKRSMNSTYLGPYQLKAFSW